MSRIPRRYIFAVVAVVVVGVLGIRMYQSVQPQGPPERQIQGEIHDAVTAFNHDDLNTALRVISPDYKDSSGMNKDRLRLMARQAGGRVDATLILKQLVEVRLDGDEAEVPAIFSVRIAGSPRVDEYNLTLHMRNEEVHAYGFLPTTRWRIVRIEGLPGTGWDYLY
jgi:hypothetical protein